jgi:membrane-bound inhibitor of C-type lysozyme
MCGSVLALLLTACASGQGPDALPEPPADAQIYACEGRQFFVSSEGENMHLWLEDAVVVLPRVPSGSGSKYQAGEYLFWSKGESAMFGLGEDRFRDCRLVTGGGL